MTTKTPLLYAAGANTSLSVGRHFFQNKKINMSKLSRMADVNYNMIRAIWDNEMKDVTVSTLEKIARALKVDVAELIEVLPDEEQR